MAILGEDATVPLPVNVHRLRLTLAEGIRLRASVGDGWIGLTRVLTYAIRVSR